MRGTVTVPIEYFVWANQSSHQERLIYYDEQGNSVEQNVQSGSIQNALNVFDGRSRTVRRSTGGLTRVEPFQMVLVNHEDNRMPSIRVRVRFTDLRFEQTESGEITAQVYQHTKIVAPEQLQSSFDYELTQEQRFVVDLGQGILPVHVIHLDRNGSDEITAYFIKIEDSERISQGNLGDRTWVQVYQVPREALRLAVCDAGTDDWKLALENYERMRKYTSECFPDCLKAGYPVETISGYNWEELRDFLQLSLTQRQEEATAPRPVFEPLETEMEKEYPPVGIIGASLRS